MDTNQSTQPELSESDSLKERQRFKEDLKTSLADRKINMLSVMEGRHNKRHSWKVTADTSWAGIIQVKVYIPVDMRDTCPECLQFVLTSVTNYANRCQGKS